MEILKDEKSIRILGCNSNGIRFNQVKSQLQHSLDLDIDIQCYSEVNADFLQPKLLQKFKDQARHMDKSMKTEWSTSRIPSISEYNPGGTGMYTNDRTASRVKKSDKDKFGR